MCVNYILHRASYDRDIGGGGVAGLGHRDASRIKTLWFHGDERCLIKSKWWISIYGYYMVNILLIIVNILLLYEDFICTPFYSVFCSLTSSCITWNRALPGGLILSMSILGQQALIIFMCIIRFKWNTGGGSNTIAYLYIIYPIHTYHSILLVYDICIYIYTCESITYKWLSSCVWPSRVQIQA